MKKRQQSIHPSRAEYSVLTHHRHLLKQVTKPAHHSTHTHDINSTGNASSVHRAHSKTENDLVTRVIKYLEKYMSATTFEFTDGFSM